MKTFLFLTALFLSSISIASFTCEQKSQKIEEQKKINFCDTLLKNKKTALEYAQPILFKAYGKSKILGERPYRTNLTNGVWTITGTLKAQVGGVFLIQLNALDGKLIRPSHGQ
jgi:NTF2 fold immunity protein